MRTVLIPLQGVIAQSDNWDVWRMPRLARDLYIEAAPISPHDNVVTTEEYWVERCPSVKTTEGDIVEWWGRPVGMSGPAARLLRLLASESISHRNHMAARAMGSVASANEKALAEVANFVNEHGYEMVVSWGFPIVIAIAPREWPQGINVYR